MNDLVRRADWDDQLAAMLGDWTDKPEQGAWCALLAADAVLALTGFDPAAEWRTVKRSKRAASTLLKKLGGLDCLPDRWLQRATPGQYHRGDIALLRPCPAAPIGSLGVIIGPSAVFPRVGGGLVHLNASQWAKIWVVPFEDARCHR